MDLNTTINGQPFTVRVPDGFNVEISSDGMNVTKAPLDYKYSYWELQTTAGLAVPNWRSALDVPSNAGLGEIFGY